MLSDTASSRNMSPLIRGIKAWCIESMSEEFVQQAKEEAHSKTSRMHHVWLSCSNLRSFSNDSAAALSTYSSTLALIV